MLKNLILSAAAAGVAAGVLTAVIQEVTTTPIILEAEKYENGVAPPEHAAAVSGQAGPSEAAEAPAPFEHEKWAPGEGIERTLFTTLGTTVAGVGFSLALLGAMALAGVAIGARTGLAFGVAGFAAVTLAPALGLPPEIPGSGAAALEVRQIWWFATAVATAAGLAGLLLARNMAVQIGGVVLLTLPHIIGAPRPETFISAAPAELAGHFAATSLAVTAIFWAVLGYASGAFYERLARPA